MSKDDKHLLEKTAKGVGAFLIVHAVVSLVTEEFESSRLLHGMLDWYRRIMQRLLGKRLGEFSCGKRRPFKHSVTTAPILGSNDLEKLQSLRDRGILTQAEFETKKQLLLGL